MKTELSKLSIIVAVIATLGATDYARANLVIDGDFELPSLPGTFTTFGLGAMGGWTVSSGSIDLIHDYWQPAQGSQSLDTAGNLSGKIQQTIATSIGTTYHLSFEMSGNPDGLPVIKTLRVNFGSSSQDFNFNTAGITRADMHWATMTWDVVATGPSSMLSFEDVGGTAYGAALDNVSLVAVPEPSTCIAGALMLLPLATGVVRKMAQRRGTSN